MEMRILSIVALLFVAGCFNIEEPVCAFSCGPNDACPDDYECRSDNYCHKKGSTEACSFSDATISIGPGDLGGDLSVAMPITDMSTSVPPDLTQSDQ